MARIISINENPPRKPEILGKTEQFISEPEISGGRLFNADILPQKIAVATLHVFSFNITGSYLTNLQNTGVLPLIQASINHDLNEQSTNTSLFSGVFQMLGSLRRGITLPISTSWTVTGILTVLWQLINIFFTGSATVKEHVKFSALGLSKTVDVTARVPVTSVSIAWD